jgi:hypothetical protein
MPRRAGDQRHPAAELRRRHCRLQLGLLELPVLDLEELALRQRAIAAQGLRRLHGGEVWREMASAAAAARAVSPNPTTPQLARERRAARGRAAPGAIATVGGEIGRIVVPVLRDRRRRELGSVRQSGHGLVRSTWSGERSALAARAERASLSAAPWRGIQARDERASGEHRDSRNAERRHRARPAALPSRWRRPDVETWRTCGCGGRRLRARSTLASMRS